MNKDIAVEASRYIKLLWDEWILQPVDSRYNIGFIYEISGNLDVMRLKNALLHYINLNPVIRSYFYEKEETIYQAFKREIKNPVEYYDYYGKEQKQIDFLIQRMCMFSFNLSMAPLFKFALIKASDSTHYLVMRFHHIIIDGTSAHKIPVEISEYYNADSLEMSEIKYEYPDLNSYLQYENDFFKEHSFTEGLDYWNKLVHKRNFYTNLPNKPDKPDKPGFSAKTINFSIEENLTSKINRLSREYECTVFHIMSALFSIFLRKHSRQDGISLLYPVSMRPKHMRDLNGYLVNSLPMIVDFSCQSTLASTIKEIKEQRNHSKNYQYIPFDQVIINYNKNSSVNYGSRFNNYLNVTIVETSEVLDSPLHLRELSIRSIPSQTLVNSELSLIYMKGNDSIECQISYNDGHLENSVFDRSREHFMLLLERILDFPEADIDSFSVLADEEYQKVVYEWNRTETPYPKDKTIQALFEEQVEKTPDNIALVFKDKKLTYHDLNERVNQLAHTIRSEYREFRGEEIQSDTLIGLYIERGMDMIVGILGILKSGAAYVPFDLADPEERLKFKINDCGCKMMITSSNSLKNLVFLAETDVLPISIDAYSSEIEKASKNNPDIINSSKNLAYIIYTSGSTGKPKGVMVGHSGVVNFIWYHNEKFLTSRQYNSVIQSISVNFDASWTELAMSFFNGSTMYLIESIANMSTEELLDFIRKNNINVFVSTPAVINNLPQKAIPSLECLISGGDAGDKSTMDYWSGKLKLYNAYGPTEATICTTYSHHNPDKSNKDIGKPLQNKKVYVLDSRMNPVPVGVFGELFIGGDGLARGYMNRPELTAERFIENPFTTEEEKSAGLNLRLYKTGDVVRWLPGGSIEFRERNDDQVKINGFRVELGEIENKLAEYPSITNCAVICRERNGNKYLAAYYSADKKIDDEVLENHLLKLIPYYMVPSYFMWLSEMPLTVNGKVDRKALPEPEIKRDERNYLAPRNTTEETLCRLWQEELGIKKIGINDDFFKLGGNSILAIKLSHKMTWELSREIPVSALFDLKNIRALSDALSGFKRLVAIERYKGDKAILSFAQERLYFIDEYEGGSNAYNIPVFFKLDGDTDFTLLKKSVQSIINRHEILRTVFVRDEGGEVYQKTLSKPVEIIEQDIEERDFNLKIKEAVNVVFDIHNEYPIKVLLIHTGEADYLLITIHHIAFDGWSVDIFLRELNNFYIHYKNNAALTVPEMDIQYRDFAVWQREYLSGERLTNELDYWKKELEAYETLEFPLDKTRPSKFQYEGDYFNFELDGELSDKLRTAVKKYGTTPYSVFLSAFFILLHKYSRQNDILIGTPTANRQYAQLENLIGFFVNSSVMRCKFTPELNIKNLIENTASSLASMQMHQDLPFEKLVELLNVEKDSSRHPLFQIMFSVQSFADAVDSNAQSSFRLIDVLDSYRIAKFDLSLFINDSHDKISVGFNYAVNLFEKATIAKIAGHYENILKCIAYGDNRLISDVELLSSSEYNQIIIDWNETYSPYPREKTITEIFEEQVEKTPENIAVVFKDQKLTYRELNARANQLAHAIRRDYREQMGRSIEANTLIGIYIERSIDMAVGILAILKAGAAYVPFDLADPEDRVKFKINDSGCLMIVTSSDCMKELVFLTELDTVLLAMDEYRDEMEKQFASNPERINQAQDLAYVIYTSGSTGRPKGVMLEHYGVTNLAKSHAESFNINEESSILHFAPISFDASVSTMFTAFLNGAALIICSEADRKDVNKLSEFIVKNKISMIDIPAKLFELLPQNIDMPSLKYIITAGEVCDRRTMDYWFTRANVINAYGPTESTVCATFALYSPDKSNHNIGKPIKNKKVYILDEGQNPVPVGVPGELYIGGDGLARGYMNRPDITEERFIPNRFLPDDEIRKNERRIYKTGDIVRWSKDGSIEFIGRNDDQVKVNGFRIELGEIESKLSSLAGIAMCAVKVYEREGNKNLAAYYTVTKKMTSDEVREYLSGVLPDYMVPSYFVEMEKFLLNTSGKIDRKALPDPLFNADENSYAPPRNRSEEELCKLWQELLGVPRVGINDDFFKIGGNSILAIRLSHKMSLVLGYEIAVSEIFKNRTIGKFSFAEENIEEEGEVVEL